MKHNLPRKSGFVLAFAAFAAIIFLAGGHLMAQKIAGSQQGCLPLSTNWRLGPDLNHLNWVQDSMGCDGVRILVLGPDYNEAFRDLLHDAGREYVHKALGPPRRSFINAARLHIDVYSISCEEDGDGQGLDMLFVFTRDGCLGELVFQGQ